MTELLRMWRVLPSTARLKLGKVAVVTLVSAAVEIAALNALTRFLGALPFGQALFAGPAYRFAALAIAAAVARLWMTSSTARLTSEVAHQLSVEGQRKLMAQPMSFHLGMHSSRSVAMLEKVQLLSAAVLRPLLRLGQAIVIGIAIVVTLADKAPFAAFAVMAGLAVAYGAVALIVSKRSRSLEAGLSDLIDDRAQVSQENLAGIRDIILDNLHERRAARFAALDREIHRRVAGFQVIDSFPRFLVEGLGLAALALLTVWLAREGKTHIFASLGLIAFSAQRLLPLAQAAFSGWQGWIGNKGILADVQHVLSLPDRLPTAATQVAFERDIVVEEITVSFDDNHIVLDAVSLILPKGSRTGLAGPTGSGKSTLCDVIMALTPPDIGVLKVDGTPIDTRMASGWHRQIAHVGQKMFLFDATIAGNVATDEQSYDAERVRAALLRAGLDEFAERPDLKVGEGGARLSGGERQRLALARAFYKEAPLLVLDEATSGLDATTERRVLANIPADRTVLLVTHRPDALAICDRIFDLEGGKLSRRV